jgi:hypothetical protein
MIPMYTIEGGVPGVRFATPADEIEIFGLLCMMHSEMAFFNMNPAKVMEGIQFATQRKGGVIFVIEERNRIVASLGAVLVCDWYSDDYYWLERWNYVHPEHRQGNNHARKLIEQAKWLSDWFKSKGDPKPFQVGINSLDRTQAKIRLYARHMPCIGAYFMWGEPPRHPEKMALAQQDVDEAAQVAGRNHSRAVHATTETVIRVSEHVR